MQRAAGIGCILREINSSEAEKCKLLETVAGMLKHHHPLILRDNLPLVPLHPPPLPPRPPPSERKLSIARRNTLMAPYGMRELFWAARVLAPPLQI